MTIAQKSGFTISVPTEKAMALSILAANSYADVRRFADDYTHDYSMYLSRERGIFRAFRGKKTTIIEICDFLYLKNCISYVLLNPVSAGVVRREKRLLRMT